MEKPKGVRKIVMQETIALTNDLPLAHPDHVRHIYRKNQIVDATSDMLDRLDAATCNYRDFDPKVDEVRGATEIGVADVPPETPETDDSTTATKGGSPNVDVTKKRKGRRAPAAKKGG